MDAGNNSLQTLFIDATPDDAEFVVRTLPQNLSMPSVTLLEMEAMTKVCPPGIFIKNKKFVLSVCNLIIFFGRGKQTKAASI